ncbi:MAG: TolB family protein, partial [Candidatus Latescibacterota bacterium]
ERFYREFLSDFNARADSIRAAANATGLPEGNVLLAEDFDSYATYYWTPEGRIRSFRIGYERETALVETDPNTGKILREYDLGNVLSLGKVRALPDGRLVYGQPFFHPLGETELNTADLVAHNPETGERVRLTHGAQAFTPAVSPDGRSIVATARRGMWMDLLILDADGGNLRPLVSRDNLYWDAPAWSPDGTTIAAALKEGGRNGIALVDVRDGTIRIPFAMDGHGYNEPSFSPDGRWLLFASDRSGVWNVYAHDLRGSRTFRLTAVPYDSEEPFVSPDSRTLSFLFISRGVKQVRTLPFAPEKGEEVALGPGGSYVPGAISAQEGKISGSRGIPLRAYTPYLRLPTGGIDEDGSTLGIFLLGGDPVGINTYEATGLYGLDSKRFGYDVNLTNRSLWPAISLRAYDSSFEGNTVGGGDDIWFRERGGELALGLPVIHRIAPSVITSSYRAGTRIRKFDGLDGAIIDPENDLSTALFGEFTLARIPESPPRDLMPGWGQSLFIGYEKSIGQLESELAGHNTVVRLTQFAPSPFRHHGFAFSLTHQNQSGLLRYNAVGAIPRGYDDDDPEGGFNLRNKLTLSL